MPRAAPRACRCGAIVPSGQRCPTCTAAYDRARGTRHDRGYDAAWEAFRAGYIIRHPICCTPGCGAPTTDVDHIIALRDGGTRLDDRNCRPFCHPCHSRRTATEQWRR
jgi:5-methylcytosine-specific restriction endonuclease McrA